MTSAVDAGQTSATPPVARSRQRCNATPTARPRPVAPYLVGRRPRQGPARRRWTGSACTARLVPSVRTSLPNTSAGTWSTSISTLAASAATRRVGGRGRASGHRAAATRSSSTAVDRCATSSATPKAARGRSVSATSVDRQDDGQEDSGATRPGPRQRLVHRSSCRGTGRAARSGIPRQARALAPLRSVHHPPHGVRARPPDATAAGATMADGRSRSGDSCRGSSGRPSSRSEGGLRRRCCRLLGGVFAHRPIEPPRRGRRSRRPRRDRCRVRPAADHRRGRDADPDRVRRRRHLHQS